jgi:preprotein translocase subunit YajC
MTVSDLVTGAWDLEIPNLLAMGAPPPGGAASPWLQFIPFILVLAIFYFVILLPMKKRQQKVQTFLSALKVNDRVITSGGIFGTITKLNDQSIQLQIANNVRIEVSRAAIVGYQGQDPVADGLAQGNQS